MLPSHFITSSTCGTVSIRDRDNSQLSQVEIFKIINFNSISREIPYIFIHYKPTSCPWVFVYDYACMSYEDRHIKGHIMIGICWSYTSGHDIRLSVK